MRESIAKFYRSRAMMTAILVFLLLACLAGWLGYRYTSLLSVEEEDLLWATVQVLNRPDVDLDLTDPATREEVAGLLNSLHRWTGEALESPPRVSLDVGLRDGPRYGVCLNGIGDMLLVVDSGEPSREIPRMWVGSVDMKRFLADYLRQ